MVFKQNSNRNVIYNVKKQNDGKHFSQIKYFYPIAGILIYYTVYTTLLLSLKATDKSAISVYHTFQASGYKSK